MKDLAFDLADTDDIGFMNQVRPIVAGVLRMVEAEEAYLVKIDNWFGDRWLGFSHKILGKLGLSHHKILRVPPFVPARVVSQQFFRRSAHGEYVAHDAPARLRVRRMQALLVLDVVHAIFELPVPLHDPDGFVANVRGLLERARASGVPVIYFSQLGDEGTRFAPGRGREVDSRVAPIAGELVIDKREPDMFVGTGLVELLAERGIDEVIICGFASEACVDATVRSAYAKGFRVVLAAGAHTTTANPVLSAEQIIRHHEFVLQRFARVVPAPEVRFG